MTTPSAFFFLSSMELTSMSTGESAYLGITFKANFYEVKLYQLD